MKAQGRLQDREPGPLGKIAAISVSVSSLGEFATQGGRDSTDKEGNQNKSEVAAWLALNASTACNQPSGMKRDMLYATK